MGDLGLLVEAASDAVAHEVAHHRVALGLDDGLDGVADTSPTGTVAALSPCMPSTMSVTSMPTMSPSRSTTSRLGMPWQITSFLDVQMLRGKPL
jgi:hypothetical protein